MNKLINALNIIGICGLLACHSKTVEKNESGKLSPVADQTVTPQKQNNRPEHVAQLTFVEYLDDGDYFQILANKGDSTFLFINETDTTRNLNRGDKIQVAWKNGIVTVPGDNEAEMPAKLILSIKKTGDGPVTAFRNGNKLKYTWSTDEEFTSSYLKKVYLLTEYYLTQTKNSLLQAAIKNRQELTYSIESAERNGQHYRLIGIAPVGPNGSNIVQWLYVGEESGQIYEYDLPEDRLIAFN
ncbi:hypothetical protein SAMN05421827_12098 [Pedobacter terrae]|uniref:Lipoprotein n=1 Tax=Pedobacter terrae TaxID=405671 RepID=A0A1G8B1V5_9SPHI|nr:hypothetical protein [Pedobacter terrae]SDH27114.1 hypothetical protein SAMN05421827_12098 [Pedobacter terrae]